MKKEGRELSQIEHDISKTVQLFEERGETDRIIPAVIEYAGDLCVSGYDMGKDPLQWCAKSDYEFWVTLKADQKDRLLLALIEKCFGGSHQPLMSSVSLSTQRGFHLPG
ncbi:MAG: hypothetical protein LUQ69_02880 [Methanoregulaceae archaeon]|nr:hypothetical protein [Methanoregulaceae archaeon]